MVRCAVVTRRPLSPEERRGLHAKVDAARRAGRQRADGKDRGVAEFAYTATRGDSLLALDIVCAELSAARAEGRLPVWKASR
jgi:hypothetical protein